MNPSKSTKFTSAIIRQFAFIFPGVILIVVTYLRWRIPQNSVMIFLIGGLVSLGAGLFFTRLNRLQSRQDTRSLAATIVSLLTMQKFSAFSLILMAILAFTWLVDYVREIPAANNIPYFSIAGACYSAGLLYLISTIVIYLEKKELKLYPVKNGALPLPTKGLMLSLSKINQTQIIPQLEHLLKTLPKASPQFISLFQQFHDRLGKEELTDIQQKLGHDQTSESIVAFLSILVQTSLYPAFAAIIHHWAPLEYLWVLVTDETENFPLTLFKKIWQKNFEPLNKVKLEFVKLANPDSATAISQLIDTTINDALLNQQLDEDQITADITGGTALMSVGMILACVRSKRRVQYLGQQSKQLQTIDVTVKSIPRLFDELMEQLEILRSKQSE